MKRTWASCRVIYVRVWSHRAAKGEVPDKVSWTQAPLPLHKEKSGCVGARIVCRPLIQHNDIILRKLKAWWDFGDIFKVSPKSFQGGE